MPSRESIAAAIVALNQSLATQSRAVEFAVDHDTGAIVVRLVDTESNRVLRQVPAEELLQIAKSLERQQNLLLRNQA